MNYKKINLLCRQQINSYVGVVFEPFMSMYYQKKDRSVIREIDCIIILNSKFCLYGD
ncbi:MAG: hypothetical protein RAO94_01010 [Candidatus Stygibacter australis]|nr:hypothetical protein [Candidatus Stygibacter australis]MDP8320908.1 hypothetical protein [Candidatus Stygibacter australis]